MNRFTTLTTICTLTLAHQAAFAGPDALSVKVQFADLDLTHQQGIAVLYDRITGAAKAVCAPFDGRSLKDSGMFRGCIHEAIAGAVARVDQAKLTAYYRQRSGGGTPTVQVAQK